MTGQHIDASEEPDPDQLLNQNSSNLRCTNANLTCRSSIVLQPLKETCLALFWREIAEAKFKGKIPMLNPGKNSTKPELGIIGTEARATNEPST